MAIRPPAAVPGALQCPNGHAVTPEQHFCPDCGVSIQPSAPTFPAGWYPDPHDLTRQRYWSGSSAWAKPPPVPSVQRRAVRSVPAAGQSDTPSRILVAIACIALSAVGILMFTSPNAPYNEYSLASSGIRYTQHPATTSCISAWSEMTGHFVVHPNSTVPFENTNSANAGASCFNVIHGRQATAVLLLILALVLGSIAGARYYTRRRT
jgi:hypothetical protein